MNTRKIKYNLKWAEIYSVRAHGRCGAIAAELQQFFKEEISVQEQPGEGFVVVWEDGTGAPWNMPVLDVVAKITRNPLTYLI